MFNVLFLYYIGQFSFCIMFVNGVTQSQPQEYRGFFNGPQSFYQQQQQQQQQQPMTNNVGQKWYYSSNQQPLPYAWYWTNQDVPSSNFFKDALPVNQPGQFENWGCGRSQATNRFARIMGGQDAAPHSYPWMVSLAKRSLNNLHLCGGALITRRHVLTAAHCMEDFDNPSDLNVIAGTHFINDKRSISPAIAITIHPQYEADIFANDIAIITLLSPLPENDPRIETICLPPDDILGKDYPPVKSSAVAIGWGSTYFGGNPSTTLKQVVLPVLDSSKWPCNIYLTYSQGQICAGELRGGADTCQADSGGPLMVENSDNRWEVIGITSFGKSCGKPNTPGIYTRVATYNSFIRSTIGLSRYSPHYSSSTSLYSSNRFSFSIILLIVFLLFY